MDTTTTARKRTRTRTRSINKTRTIDTSDVSRTADPGASVGRANRGRKKRSDSTKKIEGKVKHTEKEKEIITKPVIESSNPFFIAVCAPETYKPRILTPGPGPGALGATGGSYNDVSSKDVSSKGVSSNSFIEDRDRDRGVKTNVFLRHRNRNSISHLHNNNHPNRFIHHHILQQSRELNTVNTQNDTTNLSIELSNEELFPSLTKSNVGVSSSGPTLNFKEMVMRNAAASASGSASGSGSIRDTETKEPVSILPPPPIYPRIFPSSQKTISSSNIFLAAFQKNDDNDNDDYDYNDQDSSFMPSSAALIDSCDNKYDRLYSS